MIVIPWLIWTFPIDYYKNYLLSQTKENVISRIFNSLVQVERSKIYSWNSSLMLLDSVPCLGSHFHNADTYILYTTFRISAYLLSNIESAKNAFVFDTIPNPNDPINEFQQWFKWLTTISKPTAVVKTLKFAVRINWKMHILIG